MKLVGDQFKTDTVLLEVAAVGLWTQTVSEGSEMNYGQLVVFSERATERTLQTLTWLIKLWIRTVRKEWTVEFAFSP